MPWKTRSAGSHRPRACQSRASWLAKQACPQARQACSPMHRRTWRWPGARPARACGAVDAARKRLELVHAADEAQAVAQPGHRRAGRRDCALRARARARLPNRRCSAGDGPPGARALRSSGRPCVAGACGKHTRACARARTALPGAPVLTAAGGPPACGRRSSADCMVRMGRARQHCAQPPPAAAPALARVGLAQPCAPARVTV